jgi:hypothetical protein
MAGVCPRISKTHIIYPNIYDYITKSRRQQAEVIQNHGNENVRYIGQGEARHRTYKRLKLGGGHEYDCSSVYRKGDSQKTKNSVMMNKYNNPLFVTSNNE